MPFVSNVGYLILTIIAMIITWIIVSIPVWLASKMVGARSSSFGKAMLVTLLMFIIALVLGASLAFLSIGGVLALLISILIFMGLFKATYEISWLQSLGMTILVIIVSIILLIALATLLGITIPIYHIPPLRHLRL